MSEFCKFACHNSDYRLLIKEEGRYISTRREAGNELLWLSKQFILKYQPRKQILGLKKENLCTRFKF